MSLFPKLYQAFFDFSRLVGLSAPIRPGIDVYQALIDLIVVSEALQTQLSADVQRAFDAPQSFYRDDEYTLAGRGLTYPDDAPLTPKFVLIDTLINHGQMAEIDWQESEEDIRCAIYEIMEAKAIPFCLLGNDQYNGLDTFRVIEAIGREELHPTGYAITTLDINSDSYVFTIIPLDQQPEVEALFAQLSQLK